MSIKFKRVTAYLFDMVAVSLIAMAISVSPLNPNYEKTNQLQEEYSEQFKVFSEMSQNDDIGEDEKQKMIDRFNDYSLETAHKENRLNIYESTYSNVLILLYFCVFAYFFEGETVGKRLLKLRVVDKEGKKPKMWQLLVRTLILYGIPFSLITSIAAFILNPSQFLQVNRIVYMLNGILSFSILITFFVTEENRGLHDLVARTKVIERK